MSKDSFVVYYSWGSALRYLPDEEAGQLIKAIFEFAENGVWPAYLPSSSHMAFMFISDQIVRDSAKYAERCKSAAKRGRMGAEARWNKPADSAPMAVAIGIADTDTVTDNATDTVSDTVTDTETVTEPVSVTASVPVASPGKSVSGLDELVEKYPKSKIGNLSLAREEYARKIHTGKDLAIALNSLEGWRHSARWNQDGGRYIPMLSNWLARDYWQEIPAADCPNGASGVLGAAELEAIQRALNDPLLGDSPII